MWFQILGGGGGKNPQTARGFEDSKGKGKHRGNAFYFCIVLENAPNDRTFVFRG